MNNLIFEKSILYNQLFKELDQLYRNYAKDSGLSDTMFWILYFIQEQNEAYTQKELCDIWFYSKQTVNSALKNLESQNLIKLTPSPNNRKKKQIFLTPSGKELATKIIVPLMKAEESALSKMGEKSFDEFLRLTKEHINLLNIEMQKISNTLSK
ncbi:MarR family winged helix-turn-helix transcriptional regulator [Fusibacter ferrireducens]|uniref:Winged helix-turn-helix transcriptional regulator n=1 Tax=Fusibacter ferrireducens TaxID=2785058 RepID=A0ABR9ZPE5_9FIRM|nr:MarR family winged helix-turn-helix transcriptional regulator [Fusibacter ferrireducens]MBF4692309.1 winged helix-turn-helix transcriptional regulator [Fusibacter ferrireducens]